MHLMYKIYYYCRIWSWIRKIFLNSHFSNVDNLLSFVKSDGSHLVNLIKLVLITFPIWMIWCTRNYARFHIKIDVSRVISVIKDLTRLVRSSSKSYMRNDMFDFNVLKFFYIHTRSGQVLHPLSFI